jgi:hypothetical protein
MHTRSGVIEEQQKCSVALAECPLIGMPEKSVSISSRSRNRVPGGGTRFIGIAATRSASASISGAWYAR